MKNRLSLILVFTILCMLFTGCATTEPDELTTEQNEFEVEETTQIPEEATEIMSETVSETEEEIADLPEWKSLYIDTINQYETDHSDSECTYDLIYFDDDDIPELVAGVPGFCVSLYLYDEGQIYQPMEDWPYGAMGNVGYEYMPEYNTLRNYNNDMAGAISYTTYEYIDENKEFQSCYERDLSIWMFDDKNKNYMIDDGEMLPEGECLYYYGDQQVTDSEFDTFLIEGDFQYIAGTKSADQMIEELSE